MPLNSIEKTTFVAIVSSFLGGSFVVASSASDLAPLRPFLKAQCYECHADATTEGGLDLQKLGEDVSKPALLAKWIRIFDRVDQGEMPPKDVERPPAAEVAAFVQKLGADLTTAHATSKSTVLRRLNRQEYQNTLNDLFGTNLPLADRLPKDGQAGEFDNVGAALDISMVQMQRYLESATAVLDEATARTLAPPEPKIVRASYADTRGAAEWLGKVWLKRPDGAVVFFKPHGYPSGMLREANVNKDGWYKVRVTGYAFRSAEPITFSVGATTYAPGAEQPTFGFYSLPPGEPTTIELRTWIPKNYMLEISPFGISDRNYQVQKLGVLQYNGPGLAIQHVEVEGPLVDEFPSRGHHLVFDGLDRAEIPPRNAAERKKSWYVPKFEIRSADPAGDVVPALTRVATAAFRRPVTAEQLAPYVALFESEREQGETFEEALRTAVTAIFCSPDFLFLREQEGWLDSYALAARLSYFLTRSAPDSELLAVAATGKLSTDRATLLAQTERLLSKPQSARFMEDFTDAWLNLRDIDFTNPDGDLYPEFDRFLRFSLIDETRAFVRRLIDENLGVKNLVQSDFAMLNCRLAEHYGIEGVSGPEIRPVTLPADSVRGGILSQGSILKVSANGTNTSPVVRGIWVLERILGQTPPPPPPGIPGVEPDIRGAETLRELLAKHRNSDTCRSCHQQIDPPGFALESFDPIGGWRENFRGMGEGKRVATLVRGAKVRYKLSSPVDAAGEFADGRKFAGFQEFREHLAKDESLLAKAFVSKLLTFASGREMGFSDRSEINRIVSASSQTGHGLGDLLRLAVTSEIFRKK